MGRHVIVVVMSLFFSFFFLLAISKVPFLFPEGEDGWGVGESRRGHNIYSPKTPPTQLLQHMFLKPLARHPDLAILYPRNLHRLRQRLVALQQRGHLAIRIPLLGRLGMLGFAAQVHDGADVVDVAQAGAVSLGGPVWARGAEEQAFAQQRALGARVDGGGDVAEVEDLREAAVVEAGGWRGLHLLVAT